MGAKDQRIKREQLEEATAARLAEIVAAAERAATQVIDEAEREAQRQLADAQVQTEALAAQTDSLIAQAEEIRQRSEQLLTALTRLKGALEADPATPRPIRGSHLSAVAPVDEAGEEPAEEQPAPRSLREQQEGPAGARLLATQMAVSGSSREEIAARLRNGFEIDDPEAILDAILGPEG